MIVNRRTVLVGLFAAAACRTAHSAPKEVLRVSGEVTAANFQGFAQFLSEATDTVVGLKVRFAATDGAGDAAMEASVDENGLFTSYLTGAEGDTAVNAREGVNFQNGMQGLDGFFVPKYAGMNQGTISIFLEKQDDASILLSEATIRDIEIGTLEPSVRTPD